MRLQQIREEGFAQTTGDVQNFTGSIAAPIFGQNKKLLGCLCFVYLNKISKNSDLIEELKENLLMMSNAISIQLGWKPSISYN